jgi:high-affinity iron transporter
MFAEGIVELLETHSEAMEILFLAVFIVPALFILLKDDVARFRRAA